MIKTYLLLTKPGIVIGNLMATAGAFLFASKAEVNFGLFLATICGLGLVIASACVFNNYIDRDIDKKMSRTQRRGIARGLVSGREALIYASLLGLSGSLILWGFTNLLTVGIALTGLFTYVVLYGIGKRASKYGTHIGSISGAVPPVVGYCAVSDRLDLAALILFLSLVFWQMPHFFAIAMYRFSDYKKAGIPTWPAKEGMYSTKKQIIFYIVAFCIASGALTFFGYTGYIYLAVMFLLFAYWLRIAISGLAISDDERWARRVFGGSLVVLTVFSVMISVGAVLP